MLGLWLTTGNAPSWFAVVVAAGGATLAYRSSKASRESANAAQKQLRRLESQDERELASSFSLWPTNVEQAVTWKVDSDPKPGLKPTARPIDKVYQIRFELNNPANASIFAVWPYVVGDGGQEYRLGYIDQVPPQNRGPLKWEAYACVIFKGSPKRASDLVMGAMFLDAKQQWWDRQPSGDIVALGREEIETRGRKMRDNQRAVEEAVDWRGEDHVRKRVDEANRVS